MNFKRFQYVIIDDQEVQHDDITNSRNTFYRRYKAEDALEVDWELVDPNYLLWTAEVLAGRSGLVRLALFYKSEGVANTDGWAILIDDGGKIRALNNKFYVYRRNALDALSKKVLRYDAFHNMDRAGNGKAVNQELMSKLLRKWMPGIRKFDAYPGYGRRSPTHYGERNIPDPDKINNRRFGRKPIQGWEGRSGPSLRTGRRFAGEVDI